MKVKVLSINAYDYIKGGVRKVGMSFGVQSCDMLHEDDGAGNYRIGYPVDNVFLGSVEYLECRSGIYKKADLIELLGKEVELVFDKPLGARYERLVDIIVLSE